MTGSRAMGCAASKISRATVRLLKSICEIESDSVFTTQSEVPSALRAMERAT